MTAKPFNIARWGIEHPSILIYLMLLILLTGGMSFFQLGQRDLPIFSIKTMVLSANWPGASAEEMERLVTDPLEAKLLEVPWLKDVTSFTKPGEVWMTINIEDFMPGGPKYVPDRWYEVRKKIGDIAGSLPTGVQGPFFNDEFGDIYVIMYGFTADGFSNAELKKYAEKARNALVRNDSVEKAILYGVHPQRIYVDIDDRRLSQYAISPTLIADTLMAHNSITSPGRFEGKERFHQLRINSSFSSLEDIAALPLVLPDNTVIRLDDVAKVYRGYEDPVSFKFKVNGKQAIGLAITMREGAQLLGLSDDVAKTMAAFRQQLPAGIQLERVADQPASVRIAINRFLIKLLIAVFIVLLVSHFSLGFRTGLVVALAIPLVLGMVFVVMNWWEIDITRISLGALIIALGLLVDDAMIVVEMMHVKLEQGWERMKAATFAYTATAKPMLSGTLIAAAGFLPVYAVNASPREILGDLFLVIGIALVASWIVAVLFTPFLAYRFLKPHKIPEGAEADGVDLYQRPLFQTFRKLVEWCMLRRWRVIVVAAMMFAGAVVGTGYTKSELFPGNDRPEVLADIWFGEDATFASMEKDLATIEEFLSGHDSVDNFVTFIGGDTLRVQNDMYIEMPNRNYVKIIAIAKDLQNRELLKAEWRTLLAHNLPQIRTRVYNLKYGVPFGYPVSYRITGENRQTLRGLAVRLSEIVASHPETYGVHSNWREEILTVDIKVDLPRAALAGIDPASLSRNLSAMFNGFPVTQYREDNNQIAVMMRNSMQTRFDLDRLETLNIPTGQGGWLPLGEIATFEYRMEEGVLWRFNGYRSVTIQAMLPDNVQSLVVHGQLKEQLDEFAAGLPPGYSLSPGGIVEASKMIDGQIAKTLPLLLTIIFTLLMFQLNSMSKMVLVLATVPLALIGMVPAMLFFDLPFGVVVRFGVLALIGIIIRNSIILIDQIDQDLGRGLPVWEAVLESTVRRARPIVLTALAAILAMGPLVTDYFWGPMAVSMMFGLAVATLLTLTVFPAMYCAWYRLKPTA